MSIKVKVGGAYVDALSVKVKRGGSYLDAGVFAKLGGAYQAVSGGGGSSLLITGTPPTTSNVNAAYSFIPAVTGGTAPYTFSLTAGTLPAGLTLNASTGAITGSPTTVETKSGITLRVTDSVAATSTLPAFSIAVGAEIVYPAKAFYSQDLTGIADGTAVRTLPGWAAYAGNGTISTDTERDNLKALSEQFGYSNTDFATEPGKAFIGYDIGSTNQIVKYKIAVIPAASQQNFMVASSGPTASLYVSALVSGGNVGTLLLRSNNVTLLGIVLTTSPLGRFLAVNDELTILSVGSVVHIFVNELRLSPAGGISTGAFVKGTKAGYGTFNTGTAWRTDNFYLAALAGSISVVSPDIFVPGSQAAGGRTFTLTGAYTGSVLDIDYQIINAATKAVVQAWRRMPGPTISGGAWSGNVFAPMGDNTTNPQFILQVRAANDTDVADQTTAFTVGLAWAFWGQSNSDNRRFTDATQTTGAPTVYAFHSNGTINTTTRKFWTKDTTAANFRSAAFGFGEKMTVLTGVPCGMFVMGEGAQTINNLIPSSVVTVEDLPDHPGAFHNFWFYFVNHLNSSLCSGYLQGWSWTQGEAEAFTPGLPDFVAYKVMFGQLVSAFAPLCLPNPPIAINLIGKYTGTIPGGDVPAYNRNSNDLRRTLYELAASTANAFIAHSFIDIPMADNYHYLAPGYWEVNRRDALSFAKFMALIAYDGQGPLVTGATRSGAVITLAVNLNGATGISGTNLGGYEVSTDDFLTTKTISTAAVSAGTIVLTLSADPGAAVKVRSFAGYNYGTPTMAIGAYADGTTIAVMPITIPIASN